MRRSRMLVVAGRRGRSIGPGPDSPIGWFAPDALYSGDMLDDATTGGSTPAPRCNWCSAPLPSDHETVCPSCGATLLGDGESASVPGLTAIDAEAILRNARAAKAKPRSRLLGWISGEYDDESAGDRRRPGVALTADRRRPPRDPPPRARGPGRQCPGRGRGDGRGRRGRGGPLAALRPTPIRLTRRPRTRPGRGGRGQPGRRRRCQRARRRGPARLTSAGTGPEAIRAEPAATPATLRPCPTDCRRPARPSSASSALETRGRVLRARHEPAHHDRRRLVAGDRVGRRRRRRRLVRRPRARRRARDPSRPSRGSGRRWPGALSGLILEDAGRLCIRLATVVPADDPTRPWRVPAAVRTAFRWEPMRAAAMRPNELAETVLAAFRRAAEGLGRP